MTKALARWAAAAALLLAALVGVAAPAQAATIHGCPYGDVCVYPQNAGWNGDRPSLEFVTYGPHNLSNQLGNHYVLNNQYNAWGILCYGYNGANQWKGLWTYASDPRQGQSWGNFNLTPINSIDLEPYGP